MGLEERVAKEVERVSARAEQDLTMVRFMGVYEYWGLFYELHGDLYPSISHCVFVIFLRLGASPATRSLRTRDRRSASR